MKFFQSKKEEFPDLNLDVEKYINILLLGETGTGKSTFINALANYFTSRDLNEAQQKFQVPIASYFMIQDKHKRQQGVYAYSRGSKIKDRPLGESVTQYVTSYIFPLGASGKTKLRVIDTPGVGDTRGPEQDKINCEMILQYIAELDVLHGICCLFSSTNSRISVLFEYCLQEILSRLEKSASDNLIFIFTKTRADNYTPGDTYSTLQTLIKKIEEKSSGVKIPLEKNIFSFENDSFRYLAALKYNIKFSQEAKRNFEYSWKVSRQEAWRLIAYILGDTTHTPLKPHLIKDTVSVNEARRVILNLSRPLADISQFIQENLGILDRFESNLNLENQTVEGLRKKLHMPIINLKVTKLNQPVTVCTSLKCAEIYNVQSVKKYHYRQRCHDPCYLKNVPREIIGSPELAYCQCINKQTKACTQCNCDFTVHMHVYYFTDLVDDTVIDDNVKNNIENKEQAMNEIRQMIESMERRKKELEEEKAVIIKYMAQFAHFLQHNAITAINDSFEKYIMYLINREDGLGPAADQDYIIQMTCLLNQYVEAKQVFEKARNQKYEEGDEIVVTPETVLANVQELYGLKHMGNKIEEMMKTQTEAYSRETRRKDYVHRYHSHYHDSSNYGMNLLSSFYSLFNGDVQQGEPYPRNHRGGRSSRDHGSSRNGRRSGEDYVISDNTRRSRGETPRRSPDSSRSDTPDQSTVPRSSSASDQKLSHHASKNQDNQINEKVTKTVLLGTEAAPESESNIIEQPPDYDSLYPERSSDSINYGPSTSGLQTTNVAPSGSKEGVQDSDYSDGEYTWSDDDDHSPDKYNMDEDFVKDTSPRVRLNSNVINAGILIFILLLQYIIQYYFFT